jgi:uncharacterized protein
MSKHKFKLGSLTIDAQAYGSQGNAILGIRDSGKTYTATEIAEHLFDAGVPFVAFDPTGVWRFLRVPGKGRGYPIVVAGGKSADLPLTVAGAVEIVRAAMKNGVSLVIDLTDPNLSKGDWKRIVKSCVRVLLQENAAHGLRHIFIEEAAEFVPQRVLDGDVYAEVEKLARIGGNARLGYTLINQRSQEVNKAVLELCENLFLHRQRGKNAIQSLDHWLGVAGVDQAEIVKSLPQLPTGQCWAWMGDKATPTLIDVPPKNSFHPDRRTMHGTRGKRGRKAVDVGSFVKDMKTALVALEEEDAKTNPAKLQARVAELTAKIMKLENAKPPPPKKEELEKIKQRAVAEAKNHFAPLLAALEAAMKFIVEINARDFFKAGGEMVDQRAVQQAIEAATAQVQAIVAAHLKGRDKQFDALRLQAQRLAARIKAAMEKAGEDVKIEVNVQHNAPFTVSAPTTPKGSPMRVLPLKTAEGLTPAKQKILDAIAWVGSLGTPIVPKDTIAFMADTTPNSSAYANNLGALRTAGLIDYPGSGMLALTEEGQQAANQPDVAPTHEAIMDKIGAKLVPAQMRIVSAVAEAYPADLSKDELAERAGTSATSSAYANNLGRLRTFGLITYPSQGRVRADERLFPEKAIAA